MAGYKNKIRDALCNTRSGKVAWNQMRKIKQYLFYRRKRIPPSMSIIDFFKALNEKQCRYVMLRWFDELPFIRPGNDIDILVHDDDTKIIDNLLLKGNKGIPCDVYSVSGKPGYKYYGTPYYPADAEGILERSIINEMGIRIPSKEDYFYSLAFHAVYHKGCKSGLPLSNAKPAVYNNPKHNFTKILTGMAKDLKLDIEINMESIINLLKEKGWSTTPEMLAEFSKQAGDQNYH